VALPAFTSHAAAAAVERYLLPAGPTAANLLSAGQMDRWTDRQTDGHHTVS